MNKALRNMRIALTGQRGQGVDKSLLSGQGLIYNSKNVKLYVNQRHAKKTLYCDICRRQYRQPREGLSISTFWACYPDRRLYVDHNHRNGLIRGLLCGNCNTAIGLLKDRPSSCRRAAKYLRYEPERDFEPLDLED